MFAVLRERATQEEKKIREKNGNPSCYSLIILRCIENIEQQQKVIRF